jgi:heme/copper-type cytochrome/quinol oxidase subunit 3
MAVATVEREPQISHPEYPGLHVGMMGMYIFLCSEVMFFGSLFAVYFYLFGSHPLGWPPPDTQPVQYWPLPFINTFVLVSSGVTCHFALESIRLRGVMGRFGLVGAGILIVLFIIPELISGFYALTGSDHAVFDAGLAFFGAVVAVLAIPFMLGRGRAGGRASFIGLWIATILLGAAFEAGQAYEFINAHIKFGGLNEFGSAFFAMTGFHGAHVAGGLVLLLLVLGRALRGQFDAQHHIAPAAVTLYWHFVDVVWFFLFGILYVAVTAF